MKKILIIILSSLTLLCSCTAKSDISSSSQSPVSSSSTAAEPTTPVEPLEPVPEAKTLDELIAIVKEQNPDISVMYERENDYIIGDNLGAFNKSFPIVEPLEYIRGSRITPDGINYDEAFLRAKKVDERLNAYFAAGGTINTKGTRIPDNITAKDDNRDKNLNIFYRSVGAANLDGKPFYRVEVYFDTEEIFTDVYYVSADKNHNLVYLMNIVDGIPILIHDSKEIVTQLP